MARTRAQPVIIPSLERAIHAVGLQLEGPLGHLGITEAEAHILGALANVHECSINELHASFGHKRSTLTSVLDRLEQRGLVKRAPHPTSRRSVLIRLTDRGEEMSRQVAAILLAIEAAVIEQVSQDDVRGFTRVVAAISESVS